MTSLSVKGPELINMYVGQSEENVREGERGEALGFSPSPRLLAVTPCPPFHEAVPAWSVASPSSPSLRPPSSPRCLPLSPLSVRQGQGCSSMHYLL